MIVAGIEPEATCPYFNNCRLAFLAKISYQRIVSGGVADKVGGPDRAAVGAEEAVVEEILQGHISPVGDGFVEGHQDNL